MSPVSINWRWTAEPSVRQGEEECGGREVIVTCDLRPATSWRLWQLLLDQLCLDKSSEDLNNISQGMAFE